MNDVKNMSECVIERLNEIKNLENGFPKNTMKWKNVCYNNVNIRDIDFTKLSHFELCGVFELVISRYRRQM